jgi:hypothetical protein
MANREIDYEDGGEQKRNDPGSQARRRPISYLLDRLQNWPGWKNLGWGNLGRKNPDWKNLGWSLA